MRCSPNASAASKTSRHNDETLPTPLKTNRMSSWFYYALAAAILYGLHQVFTKLAANRISDGLGSLTVEASAAFTILLYLGYLAVAGRWNQTATVVGLVYSLLTGICVGAGTIVFFLLFQKGGPLSAVPMVLAGGAALMALIGIVAFKEPVSWPRLIGIAFALLGLLLLSSPTGK